MDQQIDLFEWSMEKVIFHNLNLKKNQNLHGSLLINQIIPDCTCFLSALAHYGGERGQAEDSFSKGINRLGTKTHTPLFNIKDCGISQLEEALLKLQRLRASEKRRFLTACMATAEHDGTISEIEYQILRGLASAISCPLGPIFSQNQ